jgi:uncharacterized membrane protein YeiH
VSNEQIQWWATNFNLPFEVLGTLAFAFSGLIEAARKKLDIVGMAMVTAVAAFGGGTLRDILLNRSPLFWIANDWWIWTILVICGLAMVFFRGRHFEFTERAMQWPDALGLGVFASGGTMIALQAGTSAIVAVIMGVITSIFGSVMRDVFTNQVPRAFTDHQPYASVAFLGCWIVVLADVMALPAALSVTIGAVVTIALRVAVIVFRWRVPSWRI